MNINERKEYLRTIRVRYFYGNRREKAVILDSFALTVDTTGSTP